MLKKMEDKPKSPTSSASGESCWLLVYQTAAASKIADFG